MVIMVRLGEQLSRPQRNSPTTSSLRGSNRRDIDTVTLSKRTSVIATESLPFTPFLSLFAVVPVGVLLGRGPSLLRVVCLGRAKRLAAEKRQRLDSRELNSILLECLGLSASAYAV